MTLPGGWRWIEWRRDKSTCPVDGVDWGKDQPNVLVIQRER